MKDRTTSTATSGTRTVTGVDARDDESRSPWLLGLLEGGQAAMLGVIAVALTAVILWVFTSSSAETLLTTVAAALQVWLLAHGATLVVPGATFGLSPLLLSVIPFLLLLRTGRRLTIALNVAERRRKVARTGRIPRFGYLIAWLAGTASYTLIATVLSSATQREPMHAILWQAVVYTFVTALVLIGVGMLWLPRRVRREIGSAELPSGRLLRLLNDRCPEPVALSLVTGLKASGSVILILLGAGLLATGAAVGLSLDRVTQIYAALGTDLAGGIILTAGQLLLLPNVVVWAIGWIAGPGFALGIGSSVSPAGTDVGPIPAVPFLAAIPQQAAGFGYAGIAIVIAAGVAAGVLILRSGIARWFQQLATAALVACLAGAVIGVLAEMSAGSAGPGRLASVGTADPLLLGLVVAAEVFGGAAVTALLGLRAVPAGRAVVRGIQARLSARREAR
ncbi:DUF6350 family protein [Saxibacter everestensis]|uniref:DUF6350 family protein n=1 Tax=Saxibacter everestensis TaxID=2909229 RepID=A0ABY8QRA9_9MICO|nr:DUF6350 family protein [Brevibacteriaceae bacterium ZFBP1038]